MSRIRGLAWCVLLLLAMGLHVQAGERAIRLRSRTIEPGAQVAQKQGVSGAAVDSASLDGAATTATDGRAAVLVQFDGPITEADREGLKGVGGEASGYVPDHALIVLVRPEAIPEVANLDGVRWIGGYEAGDKLSPELAPAAAGRKGAEGEAEVVISVLRPGYVETIAAAVERQGGAVVSQGAGRRWGTVRAVVPAGALEALAAMAEVEWIERFVAPEWMNNVAVDAERMNVRPVWTNGGLQGEGQIIAVGDSGLDTGDPDTIHPDFSNRIHAAFGLVNEDDWSDHLGHGTHVAGSVLGSGEAWSNGLFRGVAPEARLVMQAMGGPTGGSSIYIPTPLASLFEQAYGVGARIHTDSWGSSVAGAYTANSRDLDEFMWDTDDMLVLFSAGNSGADVNPTNGVIDGGSMGAPGTAKNCLTVGAAESHRPAGSGGYSAFVYGGGSWLVDYPIPPITDDLISTPWDGVNPGMAGFSSRGPCQDGRIKPDIVAPGTDIVSCRSRGTYAGTGWGTGSGVLGNAASNWYVFMGGTSMSTPLTAGAAGLARQYLGEVQGMTNPSAAMVKALLVNGARSLTPGQYGDGAYREIPEAPRPNNVEGWGQVNLDESLFPGGGRTNLFWDRQALSTGRTNRYPVVVTGAGELRVTLAWSDYPAALSAAQQLVNDLDVRLVAPSGTILYPHGAAGPDRTNNLLGIDVAAPEAGTNWIEVSGYNVPQGPQRFALMAQGEIEAPALVQIYGAWNEPTAPHESHEVRVRASVASGSVALVAVVAAWRVNGGAWHYETLAAEAGGGQTTTYGGALPAFQTRDEVEYYVYALDEESATTASAVQSFTVGSSVLHVSLAATPQWPYDNWDCAFTNLQEAVDHARDGYTILVSNGVYAGGTLAVDEEIRLESLNGPDVTLVNGQGARRCLSLTAEAFVSGFTFHGGYSTGSGGAVTMSAGVLSNCVIRASDSAVHGGGLHLTGGTVDRTRIDGCFATRYGGGVLQEGGTLRNSVVCYNLSRSDGGGIEFWGGELIQCTLAFNHAGGAGGGLDVGGDGLILNNIIHGNTSQGEGHDWYKWVPVALLYCCTSPDPGDEGSFAADPLFADAAGRDFHLQSEVGRITESGWTNDAASSPCIDRGAPGVDWSAEPEPNGERVNVGAFGGTEEASMSPELAIDPDLMNLPAGAATGRQMDVQANVAWTAASSAAWIQVTGGSGSGAGTVGFDAAENPGAFARTGTITVAGGNLAVTCTVVQAGTGAPAWDEGYEDLGGGWRRLAWFGDYVPMGGEGWIWHGQHGFYFVASSAVPDDIWLFAQDMGWVWTGNATYPDLYRAFDASWLWYNGAVDPRWFWNHTQQEWETWP